MRQFVYDSWNSVMNMDRNPLRHIPDTNTRHMVFKFLHGCGALCFFTILGSMWVFGITAIAPCYYFLQSLLQLQHLKLQNINLFSLSNMELHHTPSRTRYMYI